MEEKKLWIINKGHKDFERVDMDLKKKVVLKPLRPIPLPLRIALRYTKFQTIEICQEPEKYFNDSKLTRLVIRDAGIGDLLLLEPCLRQLDKNGKTAVTVLSRFPDIFYNNIHIQENISMLNKDDISIDVHKWDTYDDLRSYSETCVNREKIHRTDCYNQIYNLNIEDKEPRLYFDEKEKSPVKFKRNVHYVGIACDGSHSFRRYDYGSELIEYLLMQNSESNIIVFGNYKQIVIKKNKRVIDLQGKTTIRDCINIIRNLDYMISVDSGLMHVALTLHIPTVCIFSIIKPDLRIQYYTGQKEVIYRDDLECIGCGSYHMAKCIHGPSIREKGTGTFIAPCLQIEPKTIYQSMIKMNPGKEVREFIGKEKVVTPVINIVHPEKKLIMPIIVLNEEKNLPRFIELVMKNSYIGRVIAIDGGSDDKTASMLKKAGVEVYMHYYDPNYHDMQALQRNISCSFVKDEDKIIIMDIDECFSHELAQHLPVLIESNIDYGLISRRTFSFYDDINDPTKQIKDYPDYQPRFFKWNKEYKWIGSPHHEVYNCPDPVMIDKDIIHFESEGKNRVALERQWSTMQKASQEVYA